MNILYANRFECMTKKGGDTYQMLCTKEYINKYFPDINIKIVSSPDEIKKYQDYDLIHIFNIQFFEETKAYVQEAKKYDMKIVISPIYWKKSDAIYLARIYRFTSNFNVIKICKVFKPVLNFKFSKFRYLSKEYRKQYRELLNNSTAIVPNSTEELEIVNNEFSYRNDIASRVVPNAIVIDNNLEDNNVTCKIDVEDYLLEVARIEPIKNQMGVLLSCMDTSFPIVFVGADNNPRSKYSIKLHELAKKRGNVYFVGEVPQKEMKYYYTKAKAHILPSFRESPGLVTLEALYNKCNVIVSDDRYCPIYYYKLDQYGIVCDPYSLKSIRKAISIGMTRTVKKIPKEYFDFISYDNVANKMNEIYEEVLKTNA